MVSVVGLLLSTLDAGAEEISLADPTAKRLLDRGVAAYLDKRYAEAITEFEAGYRVEPDPVFLFAWAQAERLRGNCVAAVPLYERLLMGKPSAQQAVTARHHLDGCRVVIPRAWYKDPVGDTLAVTGIVGTVAGIALFFTSARAATNANAANDAASYRSDVSDAQQQRIAAIVMLPLGLTVFCAGTLELALGSRRARHIWRHAASE